MPISKWLRFAFTLPSSSLLPSTHCKLMLSAGTSTFLSPPVMPVQTTTPLCPRCCIASNASLLLPVASTIKSGLPVCLDQFAHRGFSAC